MMIKAVARVCTDFILSMLSHCVPGFFALEFWSDADETLEEVNLRILKVVQQRIDVSPRIPADSTKFCFLFDTV